jgi:lysophospholipase L1-like esterase
MAWDPKIQGATSQADNQATRTARRVTLSLGAPRNNNAAGALANWAERIPIRVPRTTVRWRLRIGNRTLSPTGASASFTQQFVLGDVYLGDVGALTADGRPQGTWAANPVKVLDGATLKSDGSDWVSPWVTDPALQFGPATARQIGITLTASNNGNGSATTSAHFGFRSTTAGINSVNHTQLTRAGFVGNTLALDKRIEYEIVENDPIGLLIGASGDEGYNLTVGLDGGGGYEVLPVWETWAGVHGMRTKTHWVNAAIVGATQTPFLDRTALPYTRFDLSTTVPDFALLSLGGNSALNGASLASIKSEVATVVSQVQALGIKTIYLATICPAGLASGDAKETVRTGYNDWIRTNPFLSAGVVDVDLILRNPVTVQNQPAGLVTSDNVHPTHGGYQRWGMSVPALR